MPQFIIIETIVEQHCVDAPTAQEALDIWLAHGTDHPAVSGEKQLSVEEREVYDANGELCEVEDH
jgi:hypothetical protein